MRTPPIKLLLILLCSALVSALPVHAQSVGSTELKKASLQGDVVLTLQQAVELALEHNPDLVVERLRIAQAKSLTQQEKGTFDPVFDLSGMRRRNDTVAASRFIPTGNYIQSENILGARLNGRTSTGGKYGVNLGFEMQRTTSNTEALSPQYRSSLTFSFTQPLLRDFGFAPTRTRLKVAQKGEQIAEENLTTTVSRIVFQVVQAYWNLVFMRQELEAKGRSLELAKSLLGQNENLYLAGRVSNVSVHEARSVVAEREEEVLVFQNGVGKAEDYLKVLLHSDLAGVTIIPSDNLRDVAGNVEAQRVYERALTSRPEIVRITREMEKRKDEQKYASNQMKPRLDLNAQYGMTGLSGKPNPTPVNPAFPSVGTAGDTVAGSVFAGQTQPWDAFNRFFNGQGFDNYQIELRFELPLRNRTAEARLTESELRVRESEATLASAQGEIMRQIRDAMRDMQTARKSMESARTAIRFIEETASATRVRYDAGITTNYEVLRVADELRKARTRELKALMDANIAAAAIKLAEGSILTDYNVDVITPPRVVTRTSY